MDGLIHGNISGVLLYSDTKRNTSVLVLYITNDLDTPFLQKLQKIEKSSFINHVFFIFLFSIIIPNDSPVGFVQNRTNYWNNFMVM